MTATPTEAAAVLAALGIQPTRVCLVTRRITTTRLAIAAAIRAGNARRHLAQAKRLLALATVPYGDEDTTWILEST